MNQKKALILEAAMKCFAQKGFHATSIQEIADSLGIAKGSIYFYFKSKDDLLLSTFKYYYDKMAREMMSVADNYSLSPRERLYRQMKMQVEVVLEHCEFIRLMMNEQSIQINEDMHQFIFYAKAQSLMWYRAGIISIYGDEVNPYALDASTLIQAMIHEYIGYIILYQKSIDPSKLAQFICERADDLVCGMMAKKHEPILTKHNMQEFIQIIELDAVDSDRVMSAIQELGIRIQQIINQLSEEEREDAVASIQALQEEWNKAKPNGIILKSLIAYLRTLQRKELEANLCDIEQNLKSSTFI